MYRVLKKIIFSVLLISSLNVYSQGKFKAGIGFNLITNNYEIENLEPYSAFSAHASYRFIKSGRLSFSLESATSLKIKMSDGSDKIGLITTLPVLAEIDLNKIMLYLGTGGGYVFQQQKIFATKDKTSFVALSNTAGIAFRGKSFLDNSFYPEYNIRISYLNSIDGSNRAAYTLSLVLFLRSVNSNQNLQPVR